MAIHRRGAPGLGAVAATITVLVLGGCGDTSPPEHAEGASTSVTPVIDPGDDGHYAPELDPADFVAVVDNPYFPLRPGSRWRYEGEEDGEAQVDDVVVTGDHKVIAGITATVVRDTVSVDGETTEDTLDWYAQDQDGNVWYLGEDTREFDAGKVSSTAGSWEHGVDGAYGGIAMPADPTVGHAYRQEYRKGEAEDLAEILAVHAERSVPAGTYDRSLRTKEWSPLEPEVIEEKSYARGVGEVFEESTAGEDAHMALVSFTAGP